MIPTDTELSSLARTIQLSVAPVFLLTALGTFLGLLSTRLGRIVDRARVVVNAAAAAPADARARYHDELVLQGRRRHLINLAISAGVTAALLVCSIISVLFLGSVLHFNASRVVAVLFVAAMLAFTVALVLFLREIALAVASVRIDGR
ncbi:DUF2721 domain-containing protein [Anaeromyxobacter diazotrophicus]|uniref:DUF2721 domain-containing protein n=1 Tax=Anaeromyxobacter diazotrophicus TaxID=2590199 RepID=A0A7I9VII4_9BACT|nr:DUF2721 domain-containing protein [Anaeromyxobacter diazotrophicus]GEJ55940.1 hypothetical protein AMYX_06810 [Anaeromyxobacter diazotrophicus]